MSFIYFFSNSFFLKVLRVSQMLHGADQEEKKSAPTSPCQFQHMANLRGCWSKAKQTTTFQLSTMAGTANFRPKIHLDWQVKWCKVRIFWEGHKIRKNLPLNIWGYLVASNFKWKMFSNFVAFSEYPNFTKMQRFIKVCLDITGSPLIVRFLKY